MENRDMSLNILSWNIGGITSPLKRKLIINKLGKQNPSIVFLQETHLKEQEIPKLKSKWVGQVIATPCTSRKSGVAILLNKNLNYKVIKIELDIDARYIILHIQINEVKFILCNIYAPNIFTKEFWGKIQSKLFPFISDNLIIGGDFNMSLYPELERFSKKNMKEHNKYAKYFKNLCYKLKIVDIWRIKNPNSHTFTCESKTYKSFSRIDFLLVSESLSILKIEPQISDIFISDHAIISLLFFIGNRLKSENQIIPFPRYLYNNTRFSYWLKQKWRDYCTHNIAYFNKTETFWEASKAVLRGEIKSYMSTKKKKALAREKQLANQVTNAYRKYFNDPSIINWGNYNRARQERDIDLKQRLQEEELKVNIKFKGFYGCSAKHLARLINNRKKKNYILAVKKGDQRYTNLKDISKTFFTYYQKLYTNTKSNNCNQMEFWSQVKIPKITEEQLAALNTPITKQEIMKVIKEAKLNKAAGPDCLPVEYLKILIEEISPTLEKLFNNYFSHNSSISAYFSAANISLIPKKGKNLEDPASYRPISVLNADYKILTSIIATRLMGCLDKVIHPDQTGFLAARKSSKNIRKVITFLDYIWNIEKVKGKQLKHDIALLTLDAEKAFDSIEWEYLFKVLEKFGFKNQFIQFINNIYRNPISYLLINGSLMPGILLKKVPDRGARFPPYFLI